VGVLKVLVTGCNGQLGNALKESSVNYSTITWNFADHSEMDITDCERVHNTIEIYQPDWIINTAAYTDVDGAEFNQKLAFSVNAEGPFNLAKAATLVDAKLLHISTDYVFDGTKNEPYTETDKPNPLQIYGKSKLEGENKIKEVDVPGIILRTSWLYGHHGENFVKKIMKLSEEKEEIQVVDDQIGSPTYTNDIVEAIFELMLVHSFQKMELIHFANQGGISWYEFATKIIFLYGKKCILKPISSDSVKQVARRPKFSKLDTSYFNQNYQFKIPKWDISLEKYITKLR